ncbi:MAG: hypothetical protein GY903_29895 [Fuerstiella sp.]|nr:hypothetical protein [Fuerstiella sp.]
MSDISFKKETTSIELPSAVRLLIAALRSKVRLYSVLAGLLQVLIAAVAVFWLTSGIDSGWFALQKLELPVGLRSILLAVIIGGGTWLILRHVLVPMFSRIRDTDVALLLERHFPQFQDRLITIVEGTHGYPATGSVVSSMLQRTADQANSVAGNVQADDVFDFGPLMKRGVVSGMLLLSLVGCSVVRPGALERWWKAFVLCEETYHLRTTTLDFFVIAQPADRRVEFRSDADGRLHLHPRGSDLELEMVVPKGDSPAGQPWVIPERARVDVIRRDGTTSRTYVSATADNRFRFILTRLQEPVTIEILAGDYRTPQPLNIRTVTPPDIDTIELDCKYPDYTGWNQQMETLISVQGSEVALPLETEFRLRANSNKPLQSIRIVADSFELAGDRSSCTITPRDDQQIAFQDHGPLLSSDGMMVEALFRVTTSTRSEGPADEGANIDPPPDEDSAEGEDSESTALPISSNSSLRFFLHDEDDVTSATPESLRVRGIPDKPPVIATRTMGIGNSITRRAVIPMTGTIQDDYGLQSAGFQFLVDDETEWRPRPFRNVFPTGTAAYRLGEGDKSRPEQFSVQPLDLTEGQTLAVAVVAADGCTIPKPNTTRAEPIVFRIVSNEELLALLYSREINLRRRFEEVVQELQRVKDDLQFHEDVARRVEGDGANSESEDRIGLTTCATRCGNSLRRQSNELTAVAESFEEIVAQLINNAIPPQQLAEAMRTSIVQPLLAVTGEPMDTADRAVSEFRVAATSGKAASELVAVSIREVSFVIAELRGILENVRDMAEFHEALRDLKDILEEQQRILNETKREQINNLGF